MTKNIFLFKGKNGTKIEVKLLHKAPKNEYENDIIRLEIISNTIQQAFVMTPYEAFIIANGLLNAVTEHESKNGYDKGIMK